MTGKLGVEYIYRDAPVQGRFLSRSRFNKSVRKVLRAAAELLITATEMRKPSAPSGTLSGGEIRPPSGPPPGLGITCSRRLIQELTADTPGNDGGGPLETRFVQVGSGGRRRVRLLAPGGNGGGGRNSEMRFIGSKLQQVPAGVPGPLLVRFVLDLCGCFQLFHAYFILSEQQHIAGVGLPDMAPALSGPTCWEAASIS